MERTDQQPQQPTPSPAALTEAAHFHHLAAARYAYAANQAEQQGDETRAKDLWQRADQNLTAAGAVAA